MTALQSRHPRRPTALRPAPTLACAIALLACVAPGTSRAAMTLPPHFVVEDAIPGVRIEAPVGIAFTPDGRMLVADVPGRVWVVKNGVKVPTPMWSGETEVSINGDRGLLGMALDPDFVHNHYLYLLYSVDPDSNGVEDDDDDFGRLTRYRMSTSNPDVVDYSTRTVLIGRTWQDGVPSGADTHAIGCLRFARDGSLLVSTGDGAQYAGADSGGRDPGMFLAGRTDPAEDIGAFRAQMLGSLGGKVLRVNPANGDGYASNPFFDGNFSSNRSRVWAYGFRNPFRFCIRPGTGATDPAAGRPGALFIGDVGWETWEELDSAPGAGMNFGWPCFEAARASSYQAIHPPLYGCNTFGTPGNPSWPTMPELTVSHVSPDSSAPPGFRGNAIIGGTFCEVAGSPWPYAGKLFYADFYRGWIRVASVDAAQHVFAVENFATGALGPVDLAFDPSTGDLVFPAINDDRVYRIRYVAPLEAPYASLPGVALSEARPNPSTGAIELALDLPRAAELRFEVVDVLGRRVWSDASRPAPAGPTTLRWNGRDAAGGVARPGLYFACVQVNGATYTRRFVRLE